MRTTIHESCLVLTHRDYKTTGYKLETIPLNVNISCRTMKWVPHGFLPFQLIENTWFTAGFTNGKVALTDILGVLNICGKEFCTISISQNTISNI